MRKFAIISLIMVFTLLSCERILDESYEFEELDISFKSTKAIDNVALPLKLYIYPNPFLDVVFIDFSGTFEGTMQIMISDKDGKMKKIVSSSPSIGIDFSNCQAGVYYCEVLYNNVVYRRQLIKSE